MEPPGVLRVGGRDTRGIRSRGGVKCAPRAEPPGVLRVEAGEVPEKGVQGKDQRNQVQSGDQVPGGAGGPES